MFDKMYIKIYKFVIVVIIMANNELEALKNEI
ncbi:aspartyl-phosphate phosphatase Spo0E family protein, partial [Clostridioides difficile]|nr:aspartyl-phosphate phosphatase Spo0E family protein [Clostridioides difficile]